MYLYETDVQQEVFLLPLIDKRSIDIVMVKINKKKNVNLYFSKCISSLGVPRRWTKWNVSRIMVY